MSGVVTPGESTPITIVVFGLGFWSRGVSLPNDSSETGAERSCDAASRAASTGWKNRWPHWFAKPSAN